MKWPKTQSFLYYYKSLLMLTTIFRYFVTLPPSLIGFNTTLGILPFYHFFLLILNPKTKGIVCSRQHVEWRYTCGLRERHSEPFKGNSVEEIAKDCTRYCGMDSEHSIPTNRSVQTNIPGIIAMKSNTFRFIFLNQCPVLHFASKSHLILAKKIAILSKTFFIFMHRYSVQTRYGHSINDNVILMPGAELWFEIWCMNKKPYESVKCLLISYSFLPCGWNIKLKYLFVLNFGCVANYYYWFYQHRACLHAVADRSGIIICICIHELVNNLNVW